MMRFEPTLTVPRLVYLTAFARGTWMTCFNRSRSIQQSESGGTSIWIFTRSRTSPWKFSRASLISGRTCVCVGTRSSLPVMSHRLSRMAAIIMSIWCAQVCTHTLHAATVKPEQPLYMGHRPSGHVTQNLARLHVHQIAVQTFVHCMRLLMCGRTWTTEHCCLTSAVTSSFFLNRSDMASTSVRGFRISCAIVDADCRRVSSRPCSCGCTQTPDFPAGPMSLHSALPVSAAGLPHPLIRSKSSSGRV